MNLCRGLHLHHLFDNSLEELWCLLRRGALQRLMEGDHEGIVEKKTHLSEQMMSQDFEERLPDMKVLFQHETVLSILTIVHHHMLQNRLTPVLLN